LSPQDILHKQFKLDVNGYRVKEVDRFLDVIIEDYQMFDRLVQKLENRIKELESENENLTSRCRDLKTKANSLGDTQNISTNSVDVLKRLSQLEQIVFGNDKK
jgi:DivIVA domain-containing protein